MEVWEYTMASKYQNVNYTSHFKAGSPNHKKHLKCLWILLETRQIITYPSHLTYSSFVIVLENKAEQKHHGGKVYNLLMSVSKKKKR